MGLIPLILEGTDRTVVADRSEFYAQGGIDSGLICIEHLEDRQLRSDRDTNASYDLCVVSEYRDHRDAGKWSLGERETIELPPGAAVIIRTREWVHFSKSTFGHVVPKVSLLQQGLSNTASKVDPGYSGFLLITVFNLGKRTVRLEAGTPFCSLYVLRVGQGVRPYTKDPKEIEGQARRRVWHRMKDFLERNAGLLALVVLIAEVFHIVFLGGVLHKLGR